MHFDRFPIFVLRQYEGSSYAEGNYILIRTVHNIYILDLVDKTEPSFMQRRLHLAEMDRRKQLPHPLYKIHYTLPDMPSMLQFILFEKKLHYAFVDSYGKVFRIKKGSKFLIIDTKRTANIKLVEEKGIYTYQVPPFKDVFSSSTYPDDYAVCLNYGTHGISVLGFMNTPIKPIRRKL